MAGSRGRLEDPAKLYWAAIIALAAGAAAWLAGFLLLRAAGHAAAGWNAVWGLAGVS
ncbi:MAG: hypothetical protein QOI63_1819, partial [Thermoplasmata archaeon]|nr:hypothetical protein [Thermoplasmata archaeon]